jgi:hypothetical protein
MLFPCIPCIMQRSLKVVLDFNRSKELEERSWSDSVTLFLKPSSLFPGESEQNDQEKEARWQHQLRSGHTLQEPGALIKNSVTSTSLFATFQHHEQKLRFS